MELLQELNVILEHLKSLKAKIIKKGVASGIKWQDLITIDRIEAIKLCCKQEKVTIIVADTMISEWEKEIISNDENENENEN